MTRLLPQFHLPAFADALDQEEVDVLLPFYHPDAEVRVLHLDEPPDSLELIHGHREIELWLTHTRSAWIGHRVVKLIDAGDQITFFEKRWRDGTHILARNMAEIQRGLIRYQYAILGWEVLPQAPAPTSTWPSRSGDSRGGRRVALARSRGEH